MITSIKYSQSLEVSHTMNINRQKLDSSFSEPLAFFPLFFGLAGFTMPHDNWEQFGYLNIPQVPFCVLLRTAGVIGYCLRWKQRSDPQLWATFIKVSSCFYFAMGISILWQGSTTGAVLFLTNLLHCRKEMGVQKVFTRVRKVWN